MSEPHDVVKLLVARMESHPEEFTPDEGGLYEVRWEEYVTGIEIHGNEADKTAIRAGLRDILLGKIHEEVLDELLNGPDKRRKEAEENEYERHLAQSLQHMKQQQMAVQQSALGQYQNAMGNALGIGTIAPSQPLTIGAGGKEAMRIQTNGDIQIGNETLNEGLLKSIKKALKL
jgi:hypothetical protein